MIFIEGLNIKNQSLFPKKINWYTKDMLGKFKIHCLPLTIV